MTEEVYITGMGSEMQGVGRLSDGRAVFVPGALPTERVRVRVTKEAPRFAEAKLEAILEASPHRRESDCPYFGSCGGCRGRICDYAYTLLCKRERVVSAMERIAGMENANVLPTLASPRTQGYRNKAEYPISGGKIGMRPQGERTVIPITRCMNQTETSNLCLEYAADHIRNADEGYLVTRENRAGEVMVILSSVSAREPAWLRGFMNIPNVRSVWFCALKSRYTHALDGICRHIAGTRALEETLCGLQFDVSPQTFMQVNSLQAENLYTAAVNAVAGGKYLLDAYCGAGTMTLMGAQACDRALGVEIVPPAIADAKRNAEKNGLSHKAEFQCADAAQAVPRAVAAGNRFDCAILDPPRKGADAKVLSALLRAAPDKIVYVSCDPATLARDLKTLLTAYRADVIQPVDMFPWTAHVETVVLMSRVNK